MDKKEIGTFGEKVAEEYLINCGYKNCGKKFSVQIRRNRYHCRQTQTVNFLRSKNQVGRQIWKTLRSCREK